MAADYAFDFEIKRSQRRKTLCLQIRDGHVQVMVPTRTSARQIRALLHKHTPWIHRKLREQAARPAATPKAYVQGEIYSYLGEDYRLKIIEGPPWPAERVEGDLVVTVPVNLARGARQAEGVPSTALYMQIRRVTRTTRILHRLQTAHCMPTRLTLRIRPAPLTWLIDQTLRRTPIRPRSH